MKFFEQAQENFRRSNFHKALEFFEISLKQEPLSKEYKVLCCEKIQKINSLLGREGNAEELEFLAQNYFDSNLYDRSAEIYKNLFSETGDVSFLLKEFESLKESGRVSDALSVANEFMNFQIRARRPDSIIAFLQNHPVLIPSLERSLWQIHAMVLSGNLGGLEALVEQWYGLKGEEKKELTEVLIDLTSHNPKLWHSSKVVRQWIWDGVKDADLDLSLIKKRLIKFLIDLWLTSEINHDILNGSLEVSKRYNLPIFGHELAKFGGDPEQIDYFLDRMPREAFLDDGLDLGEDLFSSQDEDPEEKLVRNIKFLVSTNNKGEALKLVYQLEKLNPNHPLLSEFLKSKDQSAPRDPEKAMENLMDEIKRFSSTKDEEEDYQGFAGVINHFDQSYLMENYEDIVIGFNLLNLPTVSKLVFERIEWKKLKERELVNARYLMVETLIQNGDYYKARDIAEDVLLEIPLLKDEKIAFLYLRGECYFQLHQNKQALKIFRSVKNLRSGYRLTEERIRVIEENE